MSPASGTFAHKGWFAKNMLIFMDPRTDNPTVVSAVVATEKNYTLPEVALPSNF